MSDVEETGLGPHPRPRPPLDPAPTIFGDAGTAAQTRKAFVVYWDERIPLSPEGRMRLERQLRRAVLAEIAELESDSDISITSVTEFETRGLRVSRL